MKDRISLKEIAEKAGVSVSLASFVMNGKAKEFRINEDTAKRVLKIAREHNYKPNFAAQSLREGKTNIIGIIVSDISNPFFSTLVRMFENKAAEYSYSVFFGSSDEESERMKRVVSDMINKGVDGLIVVPCEGTEQFLSDVNTTSVPLVLLDRYFPGVNIPYVCLNNFQATYEATNFLFSKGYKNPALIAYDVDLIHMKERIHGYREAMYDHNMVTDSHIFYYHTHAGTIFEKNEDFIQGIRNHDFDSFIAATNMISTACLIDLMSMGKEYFENVGVVCFDNNVIYNFLDRDICYVQQPMESLVSTSLDALTHLLRQEKATSMHLDGKLLTNNRRL